MTLKNGVVKKEHVVCVPNVERELLSVLANFATIDNQSKRVNFDLNAIECAIGHQFFLFKPLISMNVRSLKPKLKIKNHNPITALSIIRKPGKRKDLLDNQSDGTKSFLAPYKANEHLQYWVIQTMGFFGKTSASLTRLYSTLLVQL